MVAPLYTTDSGLLFHAGKILVITVGLPARGKTHISRALERYLRWMGIKTLVVSLGDYRRKLLGASHTLPSDYFSLDKEKMTEQARAMRKKVQEGCEQMIAKFFEEERGQVCIYDANNGTKERRQRLAELFDKKGVHIIMLESLCDNKEIIEANIRSVKISSPDYRNWDPDKAVEDYWNRINDHEKNYQPVEETDWPFIRIINVGEKIMVNNIRGYVQSRIVFFLMNIHNKYRTIYFARSGQSLIEHSYRADSDLSPSGWDYAEKLRDFVLERRRKNLESRGLNPDTRRLVIWTSTRRRAHHTAYPFVSAAFSTSKLSTRTTSPASNSAQASPALGPRSSTPGNAPSADSVLISPLSPPILSLPANPHPSQQPTPPIKVIEKPQMLEINPGIWDGLTPAQAQRYYPADWERFIRDPYSFRAPRAESYHDLSVRLEPTLIELEREQEDLLIIGHASVIRCLLAYLVGLPASEIPAIEVARGDLLEVTPGSYGVQMRGFHFWDGPGRHVDGVDDDDVEAEEGEEGAQEEPVISSPVDEAYSPKKEVYDEEEDLLQLHHAAKQKRSDSTTTAGTRKGTRKTVDESNFYENYAEDTAGKRKTVNLIDVVDAT